jgi:hypothetical protein
MMCAVWGWFESHPWAKVTAGEVRNLAVLMTGCSLGLVLLLGCARPRRPVGKKMAIGQCVWVGIFGAYWFSMFASVRSIPFYFVWVVACSANLIIELQYAPWMRRGNRGHTAVR